MHFFSKELRVNDLRYCKRNLGRKWLLNSKKKILRQIWITCIRTVRSAGSTPPTCSKGVCDRKKGTSLRQILLHRGPTSPGQDFKDMLPSPKRYGLRYWEITSLCSFALAFCASKPPFFHILPLFASAPDSVSSPFLCCRCCCCPFETEPLRASAAQIMLSRSLSLLVDVVSRAVFAQSRYKPINSSKKTTFIFIISSLLCFYLFFPFPNPVWKPYRDYD